MPGSWRSRVFSDRNNYPGVFKLSEESWPWREPGFPKYSKSKGPGVLTDLFRQLIQLYQAVKDPGGKLFVGPVEEMVSGRYHLSLIHI